MPGRRGALPGRGHRDPTTVVLTTVGEVVSTPGPDAKGQPCLMVGVPKVPYDVDLTAPLGNRVVLAEEDGVLRK